MAVQFHRPDLGEGMILLFRHAQSPYRTVEVALRGLKAERNYALTFDNSGETQRVRGADLMNHLLLSLDTRPGSELIIYREIAESSSGVGRRGKRQPTDWFVEWTTPTPNGIAAKRHKRRRKSGFLRLLCLFAAIRIVSYPANPCVILRRLAGDNGHIPRLPSPAAG
jgi:hypothetical protein